MVGGPGKPFDGFSVCYDIVNALGIAELADLQRNFEWRGISARTQYIGT
jgi:hypothetical protein